MSPLVLASTSPIRRRLLEDIGFHPLVLPSHAPEDDLPRDDIQRTTRQLARRKASSVFGAIPGAWILGADQLATDGREVFGKPRSADDHRARLRALRGSAHDLVTGFCVLAPDGTVSAEGVEVTRMFVRADLEDAELDQYVASGEGSGCAGGYAAEGRGAFLFSRVDGDWSNVLGLPIFRVIAALRGVGWRFGADGWVSP